MFITALAMDGLFLKDEPVLSWSHIFISSDTWLLYNFTLFAICAAGYMGLGDFVFYFSHLMLRCFRHS